MQKIIPILSLSLLFALSSHAGTESNITPNIHGETVVITGEALGSLFGTPPARLSLFAMTANGFEPVPFQIDQRFRKGKRIVYTYTGGKHPVNPKTNLDSLDELVFWSGDAGPKVTWINGLLRQEGSRLRLMMIQEPRWDLFIFWPFQPTLQDRRKNMSVTIPKQTELNRFTIKSAIRRNTK